MPSKLRFLRYAAYIAEIIIFYVLSGIPGFLPEILGAKPILLLGVALTIAVFENEIVAMFFGLLCGALCDIGIGDRIGFYAVALTILCFFFGYCTSNFFVTNFLNAMAIGITTASALICLYFIFFCAGNIPDAGTHFLRHYLLKIGYTVIFLPIFYFLNRLLRSSVN